MLTVAGGVCVIRYPNVAVVKKAPPGGGGGGGPGAGEPKLITRTGEVFLHPVSVNFGRKDLGAQHIVYHEKVCAVVCESWGRFVVACCLKVRVWHR